MNTLKKDLDFIHDLAHRDDSRWPQDSYVGVYGNLRKNLRAAIETREEKMLRLGAKKLTGDVPLVWQEMEDPDRFGNRHILKVTPLQDGGTELAIMLEMTGFINRNEYCVILNLDSDHRPVEFLFPFGCGWASTIMRDNMRPLSEFEGPQPLHPSRARQAQFLFGLL